MFELEEATLQESLDQWRAAALTADVLHAAAAPADPLWHALPGVPRISLAKAALGARLGRGCSVAVGTSRLGLFAEADGQAQVVDWADPVQLHGAFGALQLADGARLLRGLSGIDLGAGTPHEWLCAAVLGRLADTPFAGATRLQRGALGPIDDECILQFILRSPQHSILCHARASAATWCAFMAACDWRRERAALSHFSALPLEARVLLARHTVPAAALAALQPGDVIVPDTPAFDCTGNGILTIGTAALAVDFIAPNRLHILSLESSMDQQDSIDSTAWHASEWDREQAVQSAGADTTDAALLADVTLQSLPLTLDFLLGRVSLPLGRLQELGVGSILDITGGSPVNIAIEVNGRRLGRAEIVNVGGRLGVRVLQWGGLS